MIACVYCGGEHARPAELKQCWADHQGEASDASVGAGGREQRGADATPVERGPAPVRRGHSEPTTYTVQLDVPVRRGPPTLGRHVLVAPGQPPPDPWQACSRLVVDADVLRAPDHVAAALSAAAAERTSVVIEMAVDFDRAPGSIDERPPHQVGVGHEFALDRLHHLVWANTVDARHPDAASWPLVDAAVAIGASIVGDGTGPGDVTVPDLGPVWLDGGPIGYTEPIDGVPVVAAVQIEHGRLQTARTNVTGADLAPDQLAAVTHPGGSARIIAPAGSGKTRVLTERARHVVTAWNLPVASVSVVAFNKRAQEEIRSRTSDLPGLQVRTLNAIALAIVNGSAPFAPQPRSWRTIDEPDVRRILATLVQTSKKLNTDPIAPWIDAFSLVRLGLVDPVEVEVRYGGDVDGLAEVYPRFLAALERDGVVDFDGQIHRAIQVLLTQPHARRVAQRAGRMLLVDEFQDLTPAHLLLIRLLSEPGGAVFGVGDDDQTIYGYNGADPGWLIDFGRWFPGSGDHPLEVNYRCAAGIVTVADRLLRHNRRRVAKTIRASSVDPGGWRVDTSDDPVAASVAAVRQAIDGGAPAADLAVLTRVNAIMAPVQVALTVAGVPVAGGVGTEFLDRTAIRAVLAWLRLARGHFTPDAIGEAVRRPNRSLHPRLRDWAGEQSDVDGLLRLAERMNKPKDTERLSEFAGDIARLAGMVAAGAHTERIIEVLVDEIGLGGAVANLDASRVGMNRAAQGDDLTALRQIAAQQPDVAHFEGWLREVLQVRRDPSGVVLSTVHRVKGQEWPHVVVHLAASDQFPHRLADDVEEERRLFHVAITRAATHVTITTGPRPSPFVAELTTEPPEHLPEPMPRPVVRRSSSDTERRAAADHPLLERDRVLAVAGLVLVDQGQEWTITAIEPESAVAERGGAIRRFTVGAKVETSGRQRGRLTGRPGKIEPASVLVFDRLRRYRDGARGGKPAYTVFDDKTLAAIATALPADAVALSRVKGVGPAKLEQYGDDVIDLVIEAVEAIEAIEAAGT